ncbi:MAG: hypothetical protein WBP81_16155 [Solirubrobacteraceae bacterium]
MLRERYRLPVRSGWWEHHLQVEALAALAAWVHLYDSGDWDDPPGKLALLYDLERIAGLLGDGVSRFTPTATAWSRRSIALRTSRAHSIASR